MHCPKRNHHAPVHGNHAAAAAAQRGRRQPKRSSPGGAGLSKRSCALTQTLSAAMEALPPSQRDGLRPEQVAAIKATAINTIIEAGVLLSM